MARKKTKEKRSITVALDSFLLDQLELLCERDRRTKTSAIEIAIENYLIKEGLIEKEGGAK